MRLLANEYLGNTVQSWLTAAVVVAGVLVILRFLRRAVLRRVGAPDKPATGELGDAVARLVERTKWFFLLIVALCAGSLCVTLPDAIHRVLRSALVLAVLAQTGIWGAQLISFWIARSVRRKLEEDAATATTMSALGFTTKLILWTVILLLALDNIGVDITALVAAVGVGGIAIALALQNVLGDLFASLSIVLDKPFVMGDFIVVGDMLGTVEHIGLKTTRVRSLSGEQLIFSNGDLLGSRIRNFKRMKERRVVFTFGVTYQTPYEKLNAIPAMLRVIVEAQENTRFDRAHFKEYGPYSLDFEVVYYVLVPDYNAYMDTQQAINLAVYQRFAEEDIDFAYPTQTILVGTGSEHDRSASD